MCRRNNWREREKTIEMINNKIMPIKIELDNLSENIKNQDIKVMFILTMDSWFTNHWRQRYISRWSYRNDWR